MSKYNLDRLREIAEPRKLSRAEEMALETYPRDEDRELNYRRANYRIAYERGYKQAEKDLALTWEDIKTIEQIIATSDWYDFEINGKLLSQEFYEEVLKRFKETKG